MRRVWAGEMVVDGLLRPIEPFPVQPGGPTILVGAIGPRSIAHAGGWADGILGTTIGASVTEVAKGRADYTADPLNSATWIAVGEGEAPRAQMYTHLQRNFN